MKVIVAGSRRFTDYKHVARVIEWSTFEITELVSGGALGVDRCAERWANEHDIPIRRFCADWKRFGNAAGPIRNIEMAKYADALVAFWDGRSVGTRNMIDEASFRGLGVCLYSPRNLNRKRLAPTPQLRLLGGADMLDGQASAAVAP